MGDLSSMSSGLNWDEDYDAPLSLIADAYYTRFKIFGFGSTH